MKLIKSFEESGVLIKVVIESIENEAKKQKGGFLSIFLGTLGTSLLGNLLAGKGVMKFVKIQLEEDRIYHANSSFN